MARKHLDAVRKAARAIDNARENLGDRMLEAQESGETVVDICEVAGLGRTRVYELIDEAKRRREQRG
jgi:tRNA A22 N-methylase